MDIKQYVYDVRTILKYIDFDKIDKVVNMLLKARKNGRRVYVMGNGGSATTASHIAGDLNKTCGIRAVALTDSNYLITALANDEGYEMVFVKQLEVLLQPEDVVIAVSGSGRSDNVNAGLEFANERCANIIGLVGCGGGLMKDIADICILVPSEIMEQIEDIHLMLGHIIVVELKNSQ